MKSKKQLIIFLSILFVCVLALTHTSAVAQCDLEAQFIVPTGDNVTSGTAITWTILYKNVGNADCHGNRVRLNRYRGTRASGYGSSIGGSGNLQTLQALAPGETAELNFIENRPPSVGKYTYKPRFSSPHNDTNNNNHLPVKTVTFQRKTVTPTGGGANAVGCDLEVLFIEPTGNTVAGGQTITWVLQFKNVGTEKCKANRIRLNRFNGARATGYGSFVGGSGNLQTLPELDANETVELSFVEKRAPGKGKYTYKPRFSSPHNDANNNNHRPTKTVTFQSGS